MDCYTGYGRFLAIRSGLADEQGAATIQRVSPVRSLAFLRLADPLRSNAAGRSVVGSMTASSVRVLKQSAWEAGA
jgi:hypothetical protein